MHRIAVGFAAALSLSGAAFAQDAATADPTDLEDVVVEGRRLGEIVESFVDDVSAPPVGRGPARWDRKVCVGAINLRREAAQVVADHVSRIALDLGLEPGDPGCKPTILVIATDDGPGLARTVVELEPQAFRPNYSGAARNGSALVRFQTDLSPVRWWHVSMPMTEIGTPAVRLPGSDIIPVVAQDGSRLTTQIRNDLLLVWVIVDLARMENITFQQLGDYIGMVAMAQIDPEAQTAAYDTVLNLFDEPDGVQGLTAWDQSYLSALYGAELNRRAPSQQGGQVTSVMFRDRRQAQQNATPAESSPRSPDSD